MGKALTSLRGSCEGDIRDLSIMFLQKKKKENECLFRGAVEPGGTASPPAKLARGKVPGFSEVHLLSCAASAAMSVVILHFSF